MPRPETRLIQPTSLRAMKWERGNTSRSSPKNSKIAIESKRTIEIDEFVPKKEIDEVYLNSPYYLIPDGDVGQQAFAVIREAIRKEGMVALGRVVFTSNARRQFLSLVVKSGKLRTRGRRPPCPLHPSR